jgi:serine phosphatase RsbU (regulator of sigma subunit)/Tfp pilus assembly protein PilF
MRIRFYHFLLFLLVSSHGFGQKKLVDSLLKAIPAAHDTNRVNGLIRVSREMVANNPAEARKYIDQAYELARELNYKKGEAIAEVGYGLASYYQGELGQAEKHYFRSIELAEHLHDLKIQTRCYINLGLVSDDRGNYEKAIEYFFKGLEMAEKLQDEGLASKALNNMGNVYSSEGKLELALGNYKRALEKETRLDDKWGIASSLTNIGLIYKRRGDTDSCMNYYLQALELRKELEDKKGEGLVLNNIASIYLEKGEFDGALIRFQQVLNICHESGDKYLTCMVYNNLSSCEQGRKNYKRSLAFLDSCYALSEKIDSKEMRMQACKRYSAFYRERKDFDQALKYDEQYSDLKDTIYNGNNQKAILEMQSRYESQRKESELELLQKNSELETAHLKHEHTLVSTLVSAGLLFFLLTGLVYNRSRVKKKANRDLENQNELIQAQKQEITDSILYAQNIQRSMLPSRELLASILPEHFILHRPKDIVSGDFYFIEKAGDCILFSAVDCTGHGVPGALLSFLGMDILQDAVHRKGITQPSELLSCLDTEINLRLRKATDTESVRDGMDLAICRLNLKTNELTTAAAFNPVYIISNGVLEEIKPDKHAIGSNRENTPVQFTDHVRSLKKGDCIYVMSDGYADQFGGVMGKKFKYKPLKEILLSNSEKPMKEQGDILEQTHIKWKGGMFQVDDILVLGIRI